MYATHTHTIPAERLVGFPMTEIEREVILATLRRTDGNRTHAARCLGMSLRTLRNRISQYSAEGLDVPEPVPMKNADA